MPTIVNNPVVGLDGKSPTYNPDGLWTIWQNSVVYDGTTGDGKYVPKLKDYVIDPDTYNTWIVSALDPVTLIPTLTSIRPANMAYTFDQTDVLFGVGPGTQADTYRVYVDKSTFPYIFAVDTRLFVCGTMSSYATIYRGALTSSAPDIVAGVYDNSGNFLTNRIPLELGVVDNQTNYSKKVVSVASTVVDLVDGEIVTCVIYDDQGNVVSKRQLLVENTSFIRSLNDSVKYVSSIKLNSPFASITDPNVINYPLNIPIDALNLTATINYSDGTNYTVPIDGVKVKVLGLTSFISSIVGQRIPIVLSYKLDTNEVAYTGITSDGHYITAGYEIQTVNANNSYSVKVYGYPEYVSDAVGYRMRFYMINLDRNTYYDVTPYTSFAANTGPFDPKGFGYLQRKAIQINLRDINSTFTPFIHTQLMDIILETPPNGRTTAWEVSHETVANRPYFGIDTYAVVNANTKNVLDLTSDSATQDDWLTKFYYNTFPLYDPTLETAPPVPTHFKILYPGCNDNIHPISDWNQAVTINVDTVYNQNLPIVFLKVTGNDTMYLSVASCLIVE